MNNLFVLDLDKLLAEARTNVDEKRTAEQIVYTWLLKHIAKALINRNVSVNELPSGMYSEKAAWVMKWLHLSNSETEAMVTKLFRVIEEGIHGPELCDEFREHWTHNTGITVNASYDNQESDIVEAVNKHTDAPAFGGFSFGNMTDFFNMLAKKSSGPVTLSTNPWDSVPMETWKEISLAEAILKEIEYVDSFEVSIGAKRVRKLVKHLKDGNIKKYAKLMNKYDLRIRHFQEVADTYVPVDRVSKAPGTGADLDGDVIVSPNLDAQITEFAKRLGSQSGIYRKPTFANGPRNEWTDLLLYKPSSNDPAEQHWEIDRHYLEHGVNLELPLSFSKGMSIYVWQFHAGEITMPELHSKISRLLEHVLGKELYDQVELRESEQGIMLGFKEMRLASMGLRAIIVEKLTNTQFLN